VVGSSSKAAAIDLRYVSLHVLSSSDLAPTHLGPQTDRPITETSPSSRRKG